jgi:MFS transporter, FHS family, L-fucose permease
MKKNNSLFAVILVTSLFFLWGFALNLNPILIPHLKKACELTDMESAFVDSAAYIAYFLMAIPAGLFMKRFGYKGGIIVGLLLFAFGAFLFYPAAETRVYGFFLGAIFIIACGLTFLETAANPYITVLGSPDTAALRINFAQSFNGLAASLAVYLGGKFILSGVELTADQKASMSSIQLNTYLNQEASTVEMPFIIIGIVVLTVALFLWKTPLPEVVEDNSLETEGSILGQKNLMLGVLAQFFYVGAQVCVSSFFIRYSGHVAGLKETPAKNLLALALLAFMIGRFFGTFLMRYIAPARLLAIYSIVSFFLLILAVMGEGMISVYAIFAVEFFMSIMFPTIFSLGIRGLGSKTKQGSSLLIMSIVGGAIFPVIMGYVSDISNIQIAYIVPALCFVVILYFAIRNINVKEIKMVASH